MGSHRESPTLLSSKFVRDEVLDGRGFDEESFLLRLHMAAGRIRGLGLRGLDADRLALDVLFRLGTDGAPTSTSILDLRSRVRDERRSERRCHGRERRCARREVPEGPWRAPPTGPEISEQRAALVEAIRDAAGAFRDWELAEFASRSLARWRGEPLAGSAGTTRLDRRVRRALAAALLRRGVEVTEAGSARIFLRALEMWTGKRRNPGSPTGNPA